MPCRFARACVVDFLIGTNTVGVVTIVYGGVASVVPGLQLSSLPSQAVRANCERIAYRIIGYRRTAVLRQQILPGRITVGVIYS